MKEYRVWLEDSVETEGGTWWHCFLDENGCLQDYKWPEDKPDTLDQYIQWGYKVEKI